jgi:hypothetical protein
MKIQPYPRLKAFKDDGSFASGYKLWSYAAGTSTPLATYTDQTGNTQNANPVILDGSGEASVWLDASLAYKLVLTDDQDVTVWSEDSLNTPEAGVFTTVSVSGQITSTLATGTAPLVVASSTKVTNLNADKLDGADWASPNAIGNTAPAAITGTTVTATDLVSSTLTLSGGTAIKKVKLFTVAVDAGSIGATSRGSIAVTVAGSPGIAAGDVIIPVRGGGAINDDLVFVGVDATGVDQVTFYFYNPTGGSIDDVSHSWDILWIDIT